ncbi:1-deoxy-D-xylulose-5-phosphate synthase [Mycoplasmatota bacterium WC44]
MELLKISNPNFLDNLTNDELIDLSNDIRKFLIESISKTGGHLASNLGVVELTVALHKVFNSPKDKFIFDVGHQCYTHKILTGRADSFSTLRQFKGLGGFPKLSESPHDVFETGHASTSISAAAGFSVANKLNNNEDDVIAIIGDGAMTGGLALEAINHFGQHDEKIIIVLNDNEMSISNNVGAMSKLLKGIRTNKRYLKTKSKVPKFVKSALSNFLQTVKFYIEGSNIFESLGYKYYGPVDGHDIKDLVKNLEIAKECKNSVILHIKTEKGKGYEPAIKNKVKWHGVGNYKVESGEMPTNGKKSWSKMIAETVKEVAKNVTVVTPAMIAGSSLDIFEKNLIDVGIAEGHAATMAAGLAINNRKVFLPLYSTFTQRAYDNILHDITKQNLHVVIGVDRAGIIPHDGDTHQGIFDISMFNAMPNMIITMPKDADEAYKLLDYGFNNNEHPFTIRYPKGYVEKNHISGKISKPSWVKEMTGSDINIITYGPDVLRIQNLLTTNNISANLFNARFIKPIDKSMLDEIINNDLPTLIYETVIESGSLGQTVISYLVSKTNSVNIKLMNLKEIPLHGDVENLLKEHSLCDKSILENIKELI